MKPLPSHIEDQRRAAAAETEGRMAGMFSAAVLDDRSRALVARLITQPVEPCPHIHPYKPRPVRIASWAPKRVACDQCAASGWIPGPDPIEINTCDLCHRYQPGRITVYMVPIALSARLG